jgi:tRNA-guanine family transglycosylase
MFDCVLPTRAGRHGQAWTWDGPINIKNARFAEDADPIDPDPESLIGGGRCRCRRERWCRSRCARPRASR